MTTQTALYETLANEIGQSISMNIFRPGERLPSVRQLARQKRLSVGTVVQAFRLLEDQGYLDVRPQAGFYVRHRARVVPDQGFPPALKTPAFVGITNRLMQVLRANEMPGLVQFGSARPADSMLPIKRLQRVVSGVNRRRPEYLTKTTCVNGNEPEFLHQVVRRSLDWGRVEVDEIVVTSSCTEAISLCLRAVAKPGDTIAIESATFFVLLQLIESLGMKALEIPTHPSTGMSVDALELALQQGLIQACLLVPTVHNPFGCTMPDASKKRVAALLAHYDVPLVEDDIYGDLAFTAERPSPIKAYDTSGNVLLCSSFSKAITPAARIGFAAAGKFAQKVAFLKTVSGCGTSHFFQAVLAEMISGNSYDNQLRKMRREMATRIARTSDAIAASFPAGCAISVPQGGFGLWIELPDAVDAFRLHQDALESGISIMPGPLFSASGKFSNCIRINAANDWTPAVQMAIKVLGGLIEKSAGCGELKVTAAGLSGSRQ